MKPLCMVKAKILSKAVLGLSNALITTKIDLLPSVPIGIGMSQLARESQLNRENLYKILSRKGNPELGSLYAILGALGFKFSIALKEVS